MPSIGGKGSPPGSFAVGAVAGGPFAPAFVPLRLDLGTKKGELVSPLASSAGFRTAASPVPLAGRPGAAAGGRSRPWLTALRRPRRGESSREAAGAPRVGTGDVPSGPVSSEPREPLRLSVSLGEGKGSGRATSTRFRLRPQIRRDDPLNLSILLSGGKETNQDSLSSGERRGKSPAPNPRPAGGRGKCGVRKTACPVSLGGLSPSDRGSARGRCEAGNGPRRAGVRSSRSRVVWECSPKRVVNSI